MAYANMAFDLVGEVPGLPIAKSRMLINEALEDIYNQQLWSFQLKEAGWFTPGLLFSTSVNGVGVSGGTITTVQQSDQIVGDATAAALWVAYMNSGTLPFITTLQIRSPYYSLYNITAFDGVATFTIDRPWTEPAGSGQQYMIYQAYFPAPAEDFKRFIEIRDTTMNARLSYWNYSRRDLSLLDPRRTVFNLPGHVVPYEVDARSGSATLNYMMYELWPHPLSQLPYTLSYVRRGPLLSLPSDTVPAPLTESMVKWAAKEKAYLWKEAQKGDNIARGSGSDNRFLAQAAAAEFMKLKKIASDRDRDLVELYFTRFTRYGTIGETGNPYAGFNNQLNVGRF